MRSFLESNKTLPLTTSIIACIGMVELLSFVYAIVTNSVPGTSSNVDGCKAGKFLFSQIIFPSFGFTAYSPSLVLTMRYPREWTRCQFTEDLNLADQEEESFCWP